jgi:hypothetical protein
LGFPQGERVRLGQRITIFKSKNCFFREHGIDDFNLDLLIFYEMVKRRIELAGLLIDKHSMTLREGAALNILPRKPDLETIIQESGKGEIFAHGPIEAGAIFDHFVAGIENALHGFVNRESLRRPGDL